MTDKPSIPDQLAAPLKDDEVEWRVQREQGSGEKASVAILCYPTARTIMDRLDDVVGAFNWQTALEPIDVKGPGFKCGIGIKLCDKALIEEDWVWKWDVSDTSDIEAMKGAASGALKRAAVQWGIGRELYRLNNTIVMLHSGYPPKGKNGKYHKDKEKQPRHWFPPTLKEAMSNDGFVHSGPADSRPPKAPKKGTNPRNRNAKAMAKVSDAVIGAGLRHDDPEKSKIIDHICARAFGVDSYAELREADADAMLKRWPEFLKIVDHYKNTGEIPV